MQVARLPALSSFRQRCAILSKRRIGILFCIDPELRIIGHQLTIGKVQVPLIGSYRDELLECVK